MNIIPEKPQITKFKRLECKANRNNNVKYEFENERNTWIVYNFESSQPNILSVIINNK